MTLYVTVSQAMIAPMKCNEHFQDFEEWEDELSAMAEKYGVFIFPQLHDTFNYYLVISNTAPTYTPFQGNNIYNYKLSPLISEDFEQRARAFINELDSCAEYSSFQYLNWKEPQVYQFCSS